MPLTREAQAAGAANCKNCGASLSGRYCSHCGEKRYTEHDRTLGHLVHEGLHFITHFEGTFFTTLRYLVTRPGKLSEAYCHGIRKSLFKPVSLYLLLCLLYLLFPVFEGLNMRLYYYVNNSLYGGYAREQAIEVARLHHWNDAQLTAAFKEQSTKVSKFLLLVLLPLTALFFWPLTYRKRPLFFDQMVFSIEINSVYLIWGFLILPLLTRLYGWGYGTITGTASDISDLILSLISYFVLCTYLAVAARRFYRMHLGYAVGLSLLFFFAHNIIVQVLYKLLLFSISMQLLR